MEMYLRACALEQFVRSVRRQLSRANGGGAVWCIWCGGGARSRSRSGALVYVCSLEAYPCTRSEIVRLASWCKIGASASFLPSTLWPKMLRNL